MNYDAKVKKFQKKLIALALYECNNNQQMAAQYLGLNFRQFRYMLEQHNANPNKGFNCILYLLDTYGVQAKLNKEQVA